MRALQTPPLASLSQRRQVDCIGHCLETDDVGMQVVVAVEGGAVVAVVDRVEVQRVIGILDYLGEIDDAVEGVTGPYPGVDRLSQTLTLSGAEVAAVDGGPCSSGQKLSSASRQT